MILVVRRLVAGRRVIEGHVPFFRKRLIFVNDLQPMSTFYYEYILYIYRMVRMSVLGDESKRTAFYELITKDLFLTNASLFNSENQLVPEEIFTPSCYLSQVSYSSQNYSENFTLRLFSKTRTICYCDAYSIQISVGAIL